jgi:Helix-turn-helix domain
MSTAAVVQAYRFALDPTSAQVEVLARNAGAARFAFNHMLARVRAVGAQREAEQSYGIVGDGLTPWQGWSLPALRRTWNQVKDQVAPWWPECSKEAFNTGLDALARAMKKLGRLQIWQAQRQAGRVSPVQGQGPHSSLNTVHYRHDAPGCSRPPARGVAEAGTNSYARVDP